MEDNHKESQDDNDDEETITPPEEAAVVLDSTAMDALNTFQDYCRQQEV